MWIPCSSRRSRRRCPGPPRWQGSPSSRGGRVAPPRRRPSRWVRRCRRWPLLSLLPSWQPPRSRALCLRRPRRHLHFHPRRLPRRCHPPRSPVRHRPRRRRRRLRLRRLWRRPTRRRPRRKHRRAWPRRRPRRPQAQFHGRPWPPGTRPPALPRPLLLPPVGVGRVSRMQPLQRRWPRRSLQRRLPRQLLLARTPQRLPRRCPLSPHPRRRRRPVRQQQMAPMARRG
mmetsp:Transcript_51010/g.165127  ORF Transcript_51010/g.165127 Transcript_51010/m.165127 type:complete len:227 (+) Transcript_51010:755-1435(+)